MRIGGERGRDSKTSDILRRCWKDSRESTGYERWEEERQGRPYARGAAGRTMLPGLEGGILFKRHQRACRKFSPVPSSRPLQPVLLPEVIHAGPCSHLPAPYARIHARSKAGVPEFQAVV